jgi:hypothetical protein
MVLLPSTLLQILGLWQQREQHTAAPTWFPQYERLVFCFLFRKGREEIARNKIYWRHLYQYILKRYSCTYIRAGLRIRIRINLSC